MKSFNCPLRRSLSFYQSNPKKSRWVTQNGILRDRLFLICGGCLLFCISLHFAAAQSTSSGSYADQNNPLGPSGVGKPENIWSLDKASGAVSIRIAVPTTPEGGRGPKIPYIFQYNSSSTVTLSAPYPFTILIGNSGTVPQTTWVYTWSTPTVNSSGAPAGPWTATYGSSLFTAEQTGSYLSPFGTSGVPPTQCAAFGPYLYSDVNGQIHDLNLAGTVVLSQTQGGPSCPLAAPNTTSGGTNDGSIIKATITGFKEAGDLGIGQGNPGTVDPVVYPDGTTDSRNVIEDPNGNLAKLKSTGWEDSEGRTVASLGLGSGSNDVSPGNYTITAGGASYSISATAFTPSWGFNLPHPTTSEVTVNGPATGYSINRNLASLNVISQITLPNSKAYSFSYDPLYGTISQINFPQGGHVRFGWSVRNFGSRVQGANRITKESTLVATDVYLSDGLSAETHWHYDYSDMNPGTGALVTTETAPAPDSTQTVYTYSPFQYSNLFSDTVSTYQETLRQINTSSGTPVRTVATTYLNTYPSQIVTTFNDANIQQQTNFSYDSYFNEIERDDSGFYACATVTACTSTPPLLRKTLTQYYWAQHPDYEAAHIVNKPFQVTVTDGSGSYLSQTQYGYDDFTLSGSAGIYNHDDINFPASRQSLRGNLTTEKHCSSLSGNSCLQWQATTYHYDLTGQLTSKTDPKLNTTYYYYTDNYAAGSAPGLTNAYLTQVTYPNNATDKYSYYYSSGKSASHTDWNNQPTNYSYDNLNRITDVLIPATAFGQGETKYCYTDTGGSICSQSGFPFSTYSSTVATPDPSIATIKTYDGLGRPIKAVGPSGAIVDTTYDALGRVSSVSNPYFNPAGLNDPPASTTSYSYDVLGRKRYQCQPDNTPLNATTCTPNNSFQRWDYAGDTTTFYDELNNSWQQVSDGLGRLIQIAEPGNLFTSYSYDALGNLWNVTQSGLTTETARKRSFTYDSLSRLVCASNPENSFAQCPANASSPRPSGATGYSYDANGNVQSKTDARGISTNYSYDALNRLISKTYSTGTTASCYLYDSDDSSGTNAIGHLVSEWTQTGSCPMASTGVPTASVLNWKNALSYDAIGRLLSEHQCAVAPCPSPNPVTYTYNLAGNLSTSTNGVSSSASPVILATYNYDPATRLSKVFTSWDNRDLFKANGSGAYGPFGLTAAQYGVDETTNAVALSETRSYDNRGRLLTKSVLSSATITTTTTTSVTASPAQSFSGTVVTITVHVNCSSCGQVNLAIDSTQLGFYALDGNGNVVITSASFPPSALVVGSHSVVANYQGDSTHSASTGNGSYSYVSQAPFITVSVTPSTFTAGQSLQIHEHVNCNTTCGGIEWLYVDDIDLGNFEYDPDSNGDVNLDDSWMALLPAFFIPGGHSLYGIYGGDATYPKAVSAGFAYTVLQTGTTSSTPALSVGKTPFTTGEEVTFTIQIPCTSNCGHVNLFIDNQYYRTLDVDSNGYTSTDTYYWSSPYFTVGQHNFSASYTGDRVYASSSASIPFEIVNTGTQTTSATLTVPSSFQLSDNVSLSLHVACSSTCIGMVNVLIDGNWWRGWALDPSGDLVLNSVWLPSLSSGSHTISAQFLGDLTNAPSSDTKTFVIP